MKQWEPSNPHIHGCQMRRHIWPEPKIFDKGLSSPPPGMCKVTSKIFVTEKWLNLLKTEFLLNNI
jgi:hypothetical protein